MSAFWVWPEIVGDAKLTLVAKAAGVTAGEVLAVWVAVLAHAAAQRPRGSLEGLDAEQMALALGWPPERVAAILQAMRPRLHDGQRLRAWKKRQRVKIDRTAAERKRRQRARQRELAQGQEPDSAWPAKEQETPPRAPDKAAFVTPCHGVTAPIDGGMSRRDAMSRHVTVGGDKEGGSFDPSLALGDQATLETPRAALRASVGDVWGWIEQAGIPAHFAVRTLKGGAVRAWIELGLTPAQFTEALRRARAARERSGDPAPVNLGFLSRFVDEVLAGRPERSTHARNSVERTDDAVASFLRQRGA